MPSNVLIRIVLDLSCAFLVPVWRIEQNEEKYVEMCQSSKDENSGISQYEILAQTYDKI